MQELPNLSELSHGEKDDLIRFLWSMLEWLPYKALECQHALCNAHHLRELTYLLKLG